MGTMRKLAENSFWRDGFKDQLTVAFKDQLLTSVKTDNDRFNMTGSYIDEQIACQFEKFETQKQRIKLGMQIVQENREKSRLIESADRRIVHFIFDPVKKCDETPFAQKFGKLMNDELDEFQTQQDEEFEQYVDAIAKEEDEKDLENPIKFEENKFEELELRELHRLAFSVADSPFQKTDVSKFFPELHVISGNGEVLATINANNKLD